MDSALKSVMADLKRRLEELEPALEEARRIEAAVAALEGKAAPRPGMAAAGTWDGRRAKSFGPVSAGEEKLLALIREQPGITAAQIRARAGMPKHTAYRYLRLLMAKGLAERRPSPTGTGGHFAITKGYSADGASGANGGDAKGEAQ